MRINYHRLFASSPKHVLTAQLRRKKGGKALIGAIICVYQVTLLCASTRMIVSCDRVTRPFMHTIPWLTRQRACLTTYTSHTSVMPMVSATVHRRCYVICTRRGCFQCHEAEHSQLLHWGWRYWTL